MSLGQEEKREIARKYDNDLTPMVVLADLYGVKRGRIYQILQEAGVDTSKRRLPVTCTVCGKEVMRTKGQIRRTKHVFCGVDCYTASLQNRQSRYWRHGQRIARAEVAKVFDLQPGHIVHHKDGNNYHNELANLMVFANQGDHVRHHRGCEAVAIWDGAVGMAMDGA